MSGAWRAAPATRGLAEALERLFGRLAATDWSQLRGARIKKAAPEGAAEKFGEETPKRAAAEAAGDILVCGAQKFKVQCNKN